MRKRIIKMLIAIICLSSMQVNVRADEKVQENSVTELLVLIDNSKSVSNNNQDEKELAWAENICAHAYGADVVLNYFWFDDENDPYSDRMISGSDLKKCTEEMNKKVNYEGQYTDFEEAMKDALAYFNQNEVAQNQYILILSDGDFDLGDEQEDSRGKENFEKLLLEFISGQEYGTRGIVLTGMGEDYADDDIYDVYEHIQSKTPTDRIRYVSIKEEINSAIREVFDQMGIPIREGMINNTGEGQAEFKIEEDCCRAIVNIRNLEKEVSLQEVPMEIEHEGKRISADDACILKHSAFLYFENPKQGVYTITLPPGNYEYHIEYQKTYVLKAVDLSILNTKELRITPSGEENGVKEYDISEIGLKFGMELYTDTEINPKDFRVWYKIESVEKQNLDMLLGEEEKTIEKYKACRVHNANAGLMVLNELPRLEDGQYVLSLQVSSGGIAYFSNPVVLNVNLEPTPEITQTVELEVGNDYLLDNVTLELEGKDSSDQKLYMVIKNRKAADMVEEEALEHRFSIKKAYTENDYFKVESSAETEKTAICFKKNGEYAAEVQNEDNAVLKNVVFKVSLGEETSGLERIWKVICEMVGKVFSEFIDLVGTQK